MEQNPLMYTEFAPWWHLISPPKEYSEEADFYSNLFIEYGADASSTVLELGSGGGNNASFLKTRFNITLVEISSQMIAVSQQINPELEHIRADMRSVRLERGFDFIFIHDAIMYMTTEVDLLRAFITAACHCKVGGCVMVAPDEVTETFTPFTNCGGEDSETGVGIRFLEWAYDPDPTDTTYVMDFAYMLRRPDGNVTITPDRHIIGLFPRQTWLDNLKKAGFVPVSVLDPFGRDVFIGRRVL